MTTPIGTSWSCERPGCGHSSSRHSLDDAQNVSPADPAAKFRCNIGLTVVDRNHGETLCGCPDMIGEPAWAAE